MADKRITELTAITYDQVNATDKLHVGQTSADKSITLPQTKKYVLGNKTIGGTSTGDIVTIDGLQTISNKRIDGLKLNSNTAITTDSTEINLLDGLTAQASELNILDGATVTTTQVNRLSGVTSAIQTQINGKLTKYSLSQYIPYTFRLAITDVTEKQIDASTILTFHGLSALAAAMDGYGCICQLYIDNGGDLVIDTAHILKIYLEDNGTSKRVSSIKFSDLTSTTDYMAVIYWLPTGYVAPA